MADDLEAKLAQARGVLDEVHQGLVTRVRKAEADLAALATEHGALKTRYDALVARIREAVGAEPPAPAAPPAPPAPVPPA